MGGVPDRSEFQKHLRDVPGAFLPSAYSFTYREDGRVEGIDVEAGFPARVSAVKRRARLAASPVSVLFSPEAEFGDTLLSRPTAVAVEAAGSAPPDGCTYPCAMPISTIFENTCRTLWGRRETYWIDRLGSGGTSGIGDDPQYDRGVRRAILAVFDTARGTLATGDGPYGKDGSENGYSRAGSRFLRA